MAAEKETKPDTIEERLAGQIPTDVARRLPRWARYTVWLIVVIFGYLVFFEKHFNVLSYLHHLNPNPRAKVMTALARHADAPLNLDAGKENELNLVFRNESPIKVRVGIEKFLITSESADQKTYNVTNYDMIVEKSETPSVVLPVLPPGSYRLEILAWGKVWPWGRRAIPSVAIDVTYWDIEPSADVGDIKVFAEPPHQEERFFEAKLHLATSQSDEIVECSLPMTRLDGLWLKGAHSTGDALPAEALLKTDNMDGQPIFSLRTKRLGRRKTFDITLLFEYLGDKDLESLPRPECKNLRGGA